MVREVRKNEAVKYVKQAEEFIASAMENFDSSRYNAAGFNAVQAMINANDALTVYHIERRASKDHREALKLHLDVVRIINDGAQREKLKDAIEQRANAGYLGNSLSKKDADKLLRHAIQFLSWVKKYLN